MFTVIVGFEGSGKSRTLKPFARRYSVMPSTDVTFVTPAGNAEAAEGGAVRVFGVAAGLASCAAAERGRKAAVSRTAMSLRMVEGIGERDFNGKGTSKKNWRRLWQTAPGGKSFLP